MADITFSSVDDTNLRDINSVDIVSMAIKYAVFLGDPASFTEYQSGTGTVVSGDLTISSVTSTGDHTVVLDETSGESLGAYSMTAV